MLVPEPRGELAGTAPAELVRAATVARRFFIEGRSKSEIAAEFGLSRFKIARILDEARATGIVRIEIRLPAGLDARLADELRQAFGLRHAIIVDTADEPEALMRQELARAAAALLGEIVTADDVLGVGYGRTLTLMAETLRLPPCPVVQLTGALLGVNMRENSVEFVRQISARSGGRPYSMYVPQVLPDVKTAALLRQQPEVAEAYLMFDQVTKAVVAVGSWSPPHSQLYDAIPGRVRAALQRRGAIAEVCAVLLDRDGHQVASDFTDRCISVRGEQLRQVGDVVAVAGGVVKTAAVRAVLAGGWATSLIADTSLATALLAGKHEL
jgi:DNA-binding transcriptional regulator LsrR (DeoR family)